MSVSGKPWAIAVALGGVISVNSHAATLSGTDGGGVNEDQWSSLKAVVVTAQKREETAQDVPTPITVLGGNELLDSGIGRSANEILSYVPNASAATQQHGRPRWWIRGVGSGVQTLDSPNPVGIYLDDVYISNASATGFPLFDLERVEVLRGPQGTLWGKNTTGGAINFISRKPSFTPDGYLKLDYGTYSDKTVEGAFGGPIRGDQLAARAAFHYESRDGRFKNLNSGKEAGGYDDAAFRLQLLDEITPNLEALFGVHFRKYTVDGNTSTVTGTGADGAYRNGYIPATGINTVNSNAPANSDVKQNGVLLNLKWQLGDLELTSISAYEDYRIESLSDGDNTPLEISRGYSDASSRQVSQELRLTSPREDRWNWIAGLHYFHETIDSDSASAKIDGSVPATPATNFSDSAFTHETRSYAIFGSSTYNFTDQFDLTLGLRWTAENKKVDLLRLANPSGVAATFSDPGAWWRSVTSPLAKAVVLDKDETWSDWTYDLTPEYKMTDHARVYLRYAKGFRAGGYNTGATVQSAVSGDYDVVKPEYLTSYEVGVKSEWFDGRLNANANVFYYNYDDIQINVVGVAPGSNGTAVSLLQNVKHGRANGAEFEIEALPVENLHVNASLGILNTKFTDFSVQTNATTTVDYAGNRFVRAPHYSAVLGFDYTVPLASGAKVVAGSDWKYQSRQYYFTTNQDDPLLGEGGYSIGNARVSYITGDDKINFTVYANNVTDKVYRNHALPGTQGATGATTIWGEPRTVGVSVTTRW